MCSRGKKSRQQGRARVGVDRVVVPVRGFEKRVGGLFWNKREVNNKWPKPHLIRNDFNPMFHQSEWGEVSVWGLGYQLQICVGRQTLSFHWLSPVHRSDTRKWFISLFPVTPGERWHARARGIMGQRGKTGFLKCLRDKHIVMQTFNLSLAVIALNWLGPLIHFQPVRLAADRTIGAVSPATCQKCPTEWISAVGNSDRFVF